MARVSEHTPNVLSAATPGSHGRFTCDISALALTLLLIGVLALTAALVLPERPPMLAPIAAALALVGQGLLQRASWARGSAILLFMALIHGQLTRRWLESDLLQPFGEAFGGVRIASLSADGLLDPVAPLTLGLPGAVCGALLCLSMGYFVVRLGTHAVRLEFRPRRPVLAQAQTRRGSPTSPSR